ncbi:hypothetical protein ACGFYV_33265 [Streptomyces sp. NPDC048297]|uniref:hypothetical protein n=1 Tax=Streptomyces sp. NPDC048297 TaxID=3365531 RepID=UPI0037131551
MLAVTGTMALLLHSGADRGRTAPAPVSHVDTATRVCLLTSTDADATGTWPALQKMAGASDTNVVVQRYRLPAGANSVAYVNTLVQLRCSTVVTTGTAARSAVAARLAAGLVPHVRFVVVADQPLSGTMHLSPNAVSTRALSRVVTG